MSIRESIRYDRTLFEAIAHYAKMRWYGRSFLGHRQPSLPLGPDGNAGQILIVEDGAQVYRQLHVGLAAAGYTVMSQRGSVDTLLAILTPAPVLVLLEAATDPEASLALCTALRQRSTVPIILFLTGAPSALVIRAFECGADAVIGRACTLPEAVMRIQVVLRRTTMPPPPHWQRSAAGVVLDASSYTVRVDARPVKLTPTEYQLLRCLMDNGNQPMARDQLYAAVWGNSAVPLPSALEATMRRLRCRIEQDPSDPQYLRTVYGVGYQFVPLDCAQATPPVTLPLSPHCMEQNSLEISQGSGRV